MDNLFNLIMVDREAISPLLCLWTLFYASILCSFVALTYRICHRGVSYSSTFAHTLILVGLVVAVIMMIVGANLARAFALVGALSIIRFRTAVKDPKDTGYMFLAMGVGMAVGTKFYSVALIMAVFISMIMYILSRIQFVKPSATPVVLTVHYDQGKAGVSERIEKVLEQETAKWRLLLTESVFGTDTVTATYEVQVPGKKRVSGLLDNLRENPSIQRVVVFDEAHSMQV